MFLNHCFQLKLKAIIYNIASSSGLVWIRRELCTDQAPLLQAKTALNRFWCKRQQEMDFFTEGSVIMDKKLCFSQKQRFEVKNILMDLFQLLKMLTGVDYRDVFSSCLDSHSDGTHSLQRMHCWANDEMTHFSKWRNKLIYLFDCLRVSTFSSNFHFWVKYSFNL